MYLCSPSNFFNRSSCSLSQPQSELKVHRLISANKRERELEQWKMSWQTYVDDHLMCEIEGQHLTSAAIIGNEGGVWAQSETFPQACPLFSFLSFSSCYIISNCDRDWFNLLHELDALKCCFCFEGILDLSISLEGKGQCIHKFHLSTALLLSDCSWFHNFCVNFGYGLGWVLYLVTWNIVWKGLKRKYCWIPCPGDYYEISCCSDLTLRCFLGYPSFSYF